MTIKGYIRNKILPKVHYFIYNKLYGMDIALNCKISRNAFLDKTNPKGVHIDEYTLIAGGCRILSHDYSRSYRADTYIGENCFLGVNTIVLPGVVIGNNVIIGSGSIVTKNIPSNSIAVGNPCRVIHSNIKIGKYGKIADA